MQLSVKGFALAFGITYAAAMLAGGLMALIWPEWGARFMSLAGSLYPGVGGVTLWSAIVAAIYAFIDGAIGGAVFAWLYNRFAGSGASAAA